MAYEELIDAEMIKIAERYPAVERVIFGDILGFDNHYIFVAGPELDFGDCLYHPINEELSNLELGLKDSGRIVGHSIKVETLFLKNPHFTKEKRIVYEK